MGKLFASTFGLIALACVLLFLACLGLALPGDLLLNLAFGWIFYLGRVLPQIQVNGAGVATAGVCLIALAVGLQWFLRWFVGQMPQDATVGEPPAPAWPARRTAVILGLIVLMFVAGMASSASPTKRPGC
jgi:fucose 4-O-acetylase-like acetyltransferase